MTYSPCENIVYTVLTSALPVNWIAGLPATPIFEVCPTSTGFFDPFRKSSTNFSSVFPFAGYITATIFEYSSNIQLSARIAPGYADNQFSVGAPSDAMVTRGIMFWLRVRRLFVPYHTPTPKRAMMAETIRILAKVYINFPYNNARQRDCATVAYSVKMFCL